MNTKRGISISFLSILWLAAAALCADDPKDERFEKAEQWKMAAQNREMAAATQQDQAESLLQTAESFRKKEYLKESERRAWFDKAGDMEKTAGDLLGAAFMNLDKAIANWQSVAELYKTLGEKEREAEARLNFEAARRAAIEACAAAGDAYERAADAYSPANAAQPMKEAQASERAAQFREMLAARQR